MTLPCFCFHFCSLICRSKANEIWNRVANLAVLAIPVLSIVSVDDEFVVLSVRNVFFVDEKLRNSLQRSSFLQIWGTCMSRSYSDATLVTVDVSLGVQF